MLLTIQREQWQALTAVCAIPAFYAGKTPMPLLIDDGAGANAVTIPHDSAKATDWGANTAAARAIAMQYWKKAELVFVVWNYEQALWVVPSATLMSAPNLVSPARNCCNSWDAAGGDGGRGLRARRAFGVAGEQARGVDVPNDAHESGGAGL